MFFKNNPHTSVDAVSQCPIKWMQNTSQSLMKSALKEVQTARDYFVE